MNLVKYSVLLDFFMSKSDAFKKIVSEVVENIDIEKLKEIAKDEKIDKEKITEMLSNILGTEEGNKIISKAQKLVEEKSEELGIE